ncbi:YceI-like domain-containing protein [Pedobacter steynii]|uniref:YceI-like domain-containing protein n=1 Tax=Pedobacter steynii TaxID=430522 RepID=A0A1H0J652_9SPHI|nr:YceI family protein [Pedobacter steynii]NQX43040.1 YceI family protein [Pedobacter steynii]SDO39082.1 YceI-like domain-containing protein [Pedobacter steynii]
MTWINNIKRLLLSGIFFAIQLNAMAQTYTSKNIKLALYSSTPLEDIRAATDKCTGVIIKDSREIAFQVAVKSFEFDRKLMQEHFNENYMESDRYPYAKFKGVLDQQIDWNKDGIYNVTVTGMLTVHGIDKKRTVPGKISISNGQVAVSTEFKVACVDHGIKIPKLVFTKIAEQINIKVSGKFNQLK